MIKYAVVVGNDVIAKYSNLSEAFKEYKYLIRVFSDLLSVGRELDNSVSLVALYDVTVPEDDE